MSYCDWVLLFSGPPCAGKGTQRRLLLEKLGVYGISTGDCCRAVTETELSPEMVALREQSQVWLSEATSDPASAKKLIAEMKAEVAAGRLVPDEPVALFVKGFLAQSGHGVVDGYPRTVTQAVLLDGLLSELDINHKKVLMFAFDVDPDDLPERFETRGRANEKDPAVVAARLAVDAANRKHVEGYYKGLGRLRRIDARGDIPTVFARICNELEGLGFIPRSLGRSLIPHPPAPQLAACAA